MSNPSHGPSLAGPRTPGDSGEADPALAAALEAWGEASDAARERDPAARAGGAAGPGAGSAAGSAARARVYAALPDARLFVPVVATLVADETAEATGLRAEKSSEMSVVTLVGRSGATALPAFTSPASMRRWRLDARPVPVTGREACLAARDGGHAAVVVEPGGVAFPVEGSALASLASGWVPAAGEPGAERLASRRVGEGLRFGAPVSPLPVGARAALEAFVAAEPTVREAWLVEAVVGDEPGAPTVGLVLARDVTAAEVAALVARLGRSAGADLPGSAGLDVAVLGVGQRAEAALVGEPLHPTGAGSGRDDPGPAGASGSGGTSPRGRRWWRRRR